MPDPGPAPDCLVCRAGNLDEIADIAISTSDADGHVCRSCQQLTAHLKATYLEERVKLRARESDSPFLPTLPGLGDAPTDETIN